LEKLKSDVRITLNDTFFEKLGDIVDLVETRTSTGTSSAGFLQAIIRNLLIVKRFKFVLQLIDDNYS
jgi:hypothetical protein